MPPFRADDRDRTGDLNLGKVALYQLSYVRAAAMVPRRGSNPHLPVEPKPPSPRSESGRVSTISYS